MPALGPKRRYLQGCRDTLFSGGFPIRATGRIELMDGDDSSNKVDSQSQIQKQKKALEKAKSVVQRPVVQKAVPPDHITPQTQPTFITYPEFAPTNSQSPKTLLTLHRLLLVLYLCAGTTTAVYAVSKVL